MSRAGLKLFRAPAWGKAEIHMFKRPAHDQRRPLLPPGKSVLPAAGMDTSRSGSSFHTTLPFGRFKPVVPGGAYTFINLMI